MKIGVMSDTHGDVAAIRRAVIAAGPVDFWLHGGDYSQDSHFLAEFTGLEVIAVQGNCDGTTGAKIDEYIDAGPVKIWLTHGHRYPAKDRVADLIWWGVKYGVQAVVYGHTHIPDITCRENLIIFNPGSPSRPRGGSKASCGVLDIGPGGAVQAHLIEVAKA